jgi:hypothetical protein
MRTSPFDWGELGAAGASESAGSVVEWVDRFLGV